MSTKVHADTLILFDGTEKNVSDIGAGGGASVFVDLTDVPAAYTGSGGYVVLVKVDESGLEFANPSGISVSYAATCGDADTIDGSHAADFASATHAGEHQSGGGDPIKLDDLAAPDDNADLDASTSKHGLLKKLPGGTTYFLRADGTFANPVLSAGGVAILATSVTEETVSNDNTEKTYYTWTIPGGTLGTAGILRFTVNGIVLNASSTSRTITVAVKLGGTEIWKATTASFVNNAVARPLFIQLTLNARGATNSQFLHGEMHLGAIGGTTGFGGFSGTLASDAALSAEAAKDSTGDLALLVSITMSYASANFSWTRYSAIVERLN